MKLIIFSLILLISLSLQATIHSVKQDGTGDYTTIQEAIDSPTVLAMDTILVYPGTYYENLIFNKKCWLGSLYMTTEDEQYKHSAIIDGNQSGTVIKITEEGANVREINGFTIQNGENNEGDGGGLYLNNANKTKIKNCIIKNNVSNAGSAIFLWESDFVQLIGLDIIYNVGKSGALYNGYSSDVFVSNTSIRFNRGTVGAGITHGTYGNPSFVFDPINRCSIYMNYGSLGSDFFMGNGNPESFVLYLDTLTVFNPDQTFIQTMNGQGQIIPYDLDVWHSVIIPVNQDLFVNPYSGSDYNSGLNPIEALKTIAFAYKLIASDSTHPNTIHLAPGIYSKSTNDEIFPFPCRDYISLVGDSVNVPVIDLEGQPQFTYAIKAKEFQYKNLIIKNINAYYFGSNSVSNYYQLSEKFVHKNLSFYNCITDRKTLGIYASTNYLLDNIQIDSSQGVAFGIGEGALSYSKRGSIKGLKITNNTPIDDSGVLGGWPMTIAGTYSYWDEYKISNLQITQNTSAYDTDFPVSGKSAMLISNNVKVKITNATIADNGFTGPYNSLVSAMVVKDGAEVEVYNSIFYGDTINEILLSSGSSLDIAYSNIEGGEEEIYVVNGCVLNYLEGNLDTIPYFNDTSTYPYQLRWDSPLIDKGTPMYVNGMEPPYIKIIEEKICLIGIYGDSIWLPSTDLAGKPRIKGGRIDMGAYEYQDTATRIKNHYLRDIENFSAKVFPNPFRHNLFIDYEQREKIKGLALFIYDVKGYEVCRLAKKGSIYANRGREIWNGKDEWGQEMPTGTYFLYGIADGIRIFGEKVVKK